MRIAVAEEFGAALHRLTNEFEVPATDRNRAAAAAFGIAQDHHAAIVFLMKNSFHSSSFALLRLLFEAYLRGLWLSHCATDKQVSGYFQGEDPPRTMVAEIEATEAYQGQVLSRIKKDYWRVMCDYTHTGGQHLLRWQTKNSIEPTFKESELEECLNCAELFGAMAGLALIQLSASGSSGQEVLELMKKRWP